MTESYVEFLCKIASNINQLDNPTHNLLRSYYLMKCKATTGGYGLPANKFSSIVRCPKCCLEFTKEAPVMLKTNPLSKRQHKRLKSQKSKMRQKKLEYTNKLLHGNILEQSCAFCLHTSRTYIEKPKMNHIKSKNDSKESNCDVKNEIGKRKKDNHSIKKKTKDNKVKININKVTARENNKTNLYTNAFDIFSLKNEKNTLKSAVKESPKVIKNSKRKKDKFAGLCQNAVLASAKLKEENVKQNKLNLFLKPSSNT